MSLRKSIGITGSRHGMTYAQEQWFVGKASDTPMREFHYGDCVGVDEQALGLWVMCGGGVPYSHPATMSPEWDAKWRARTAEKYPALGIIEADATYPAKRNEHIVRACDELWAFPEALEATKPGSGTWLTVRIARRYEKPIYVVFPDGEVLTENV